MAVSFRQDQPDLQDKDADDSAHFILMIMRSACLLAPNEGVSELPHSKAAATFGLRQFSAAFPLPFCSAV
ncbi:MAG TPA: hypothetical protein DCS43_10620 [Verrucomicrobia bacterium]|nr:hypothetical protein [Verrucomicrobiota bacterium]